MRKHGTYKEKPQNHGNSALLKTYLTSLLSLVLCVTMFLGTTMAWFTDEVGSKGNEIYVGNLMVDLVHENVSLSDHPDHLIFGDNPEAQFYFYPGALRVETLEVDYGSQDAKNIPFRYRLGAQLLDNAGNKLLNDGTNADAYGLADCFEVYVHTGDTSENVTIETIQADNSGWTDVGTLAQVLAGKLLYESSKIEDGYETVTHQIALYMRTDTPSDYIGKSLTNIYIYLLAYQDAAQATTMVNNAADLAAAVEAGGTVVLTQDVENITGIKTTNGTVLTLDFNGCEMSVGMPVGSTGTVTNGMQLLKGSTVTLRNGTYKPANNSVKMLIQNYSNLTLENVTLDAHDQSQIGYVLSNNCGDVLITGNTNILAYDGNAAFDAYYWPNNGYRDGVRVVIDENMTGLIKGKIEFDDDGTDPTGAADPAKHSITIKGGYFTEDPSAYVPQGYEVIASTRTFTIGGNTYTAAYQVVPGSQG